MNDIQPAYFQKSRYFLKGADGTVLISAPIGWDEDSKIFKRSKDLHGIFVSLSNNLEFYNGDKKNNGGYSLIRYTYEKYGINAKLLLVKEEDESGTWVEAYRGYFDFSTYERDEIKISIKFNESGLYENIKSRGKQDLEISRKDTMDGFPAEDVKIDTVSLEPRGVLIISQLNRTEGDGTIMYAYNEDDFIMQEIRNFKNYSDILFYFGFDLNQRACPIPLTMISETAGNVQTVYGYNLTADSIGEGYGSNGNTALMFYADSPDNIELAFDFDIEIETDTYNTATEIRIDLVKYDNGTFYDYAGYTNLLLVSSPTLSTKYNYSGSINTNVNIGESFCLAVRVKGTSSSAFAIKINKANVLIRDYIAIPGSLSQFILPFEGLSKILNVITNEKNILKSNALGRTDIGYSEDGFASLNGITSGFWIRNFKDRDFTTSLQSFMDSFTACWQLGYGIEKIGFTEYFRAEHISHFYNEQVTIKIPGRPSRIVRKCAKDYFYSAIELGYEQPSGTRLYDESQGLDEYNVRNKFSTAITRIENKFLSVSNYRADSTGIEFARRKQQFEFPQTDTRYDYENFIIDMKRGEAEVFQRRLWADDFIVPEPFNYYTTGTYSPDKASNLRLSPANTLLRWGFWIKGGFMKNLTEYTRYSSSEGNVLLATQLDKPGSIPIVENGNILNSNFDKNLFNPEIIEFDFKVSTDLMKQVQGFIVDDDGDYIMNYYGLVEFINEDGNYEYGYLLSLEPNGNGKWELLSSTKRVSSTTFNTEIPSNKIIDPIDLTATQI